VLTGAMKLLHPYMPFITEEIYQALPHDCESIMISDWPKADAALQDKVAEKGMGAIMDAIKSIREMRAQVNVNPGKKVPAILLVADELMEVFKENAAYIHLLANVDELQLLPPDTPKPENAMAAVNAGVEVYLPLKGLIDVEIETARLNKDLAGLQKEMKRVSGKLQNQSFLAKAPQEVIAKEQAKAEEFAAKIKTIEERLAYLKTI
ncbi:MAG: class I tRNA ligase family protein, partial [Acidaminococcaceae bacterium]|nr:class I tRNA ligase family protein [Acidaminococcaceae bacterium]